MSSIFIPRINSGQIPGVECAKGRTDAERMARESGIFRVITVTMEGGWMIFDSQTDYDVWRKQK